MFFATVDQMTMQMRESVLANIEEQDPGAIAILDEWLAEYIADGKTILRFCIDAERPEVLRAVRRRDG